MNAAPFANAALGPYAATAAVLVLAALCAWLLHRVERSASRHLSHHYGWRSVMATAWLGTAVHELSHLVFCKLLGLRVVAYKLFDPDPRTGTLGYVFYAQDDSGLWAAVRRVAVAAAPLVMGTFLLLVSLRLLVPEAFPGSTATGIGPINSLGALATGLGETLSRVFNPGRLTDWRFWLFCYVCLCVGHHMAPSRTDLRNTWPGLMVLTALAAAAFLFLLHLAGTQPSLSKAFHLAFPPAVALAFTVTLSFFYLLLVKAVTRIFP
jgi:hypothetical protein